MATRIGDLIYLGNFAEMDADDSDISIEQASVLEGQTVRPLVVEVTEVDGAEDGIIHIDNYTTRDDFLYDLGSGVVETDLDSVSSFNVEILFGDGSTETRDLTLLQFTNGDVFAFGGTSSFNDANVQSITINTHISDYAGTMTSGNPFSTNTAVVCFAADTGILTPNGEVLARDLKVGNIVETRSGPKQVRWINTSYHDHPGPQAPIVFEPNSLGNGVPHNTLRLSLQHCVVIDADLHKYLCGHRSILVSAKSLLPLGGVHQAAPDVAVTYVHIAFDSHEVVFANGTAVESFWPGKQALIALSPRSLLLLHVRAPRLLEAFEKNQSAAPIVKGQTRKTIVNDLASRDILKCQGAIQDPLRV